MAAHHLPLGIQKIPGLQLLAGVGGEKSGVIPAGYEADVLTVVLAGVEKAVLFRQLPYLGLGEITQGEANLGQLLLAEAGEEIGLVLGPVRRSH